MKWDSVLSKMRTIAFPESSYHVELIKDNCPSVDIYFIKNDCALSKSEFSPGREVIYFDADKFSRNPFESFRVNRFLYQALVNIMSDCFVSKVILFGDSKPFHKFIIDYCIDNRIRIELWEDGLGYYIGSGHRLKFIVKSSLKVFLGAYARGAFLEKYRREEIVTRDRFIQRNLNYKMSNPAYKVKKD